MAAGERPCRIDDPPAFLSSNDCIHRSKASGNENRIQAVRLSGQIFLPFFHPLSLPLKTLDRWFIATLTLVVILMKLPMELILSLGEYDWKILPTD